MIKFYTFIILFVISSLLHGEAYFMKCSQSGIGCEWFLDKELKNTDAGVISEDWVVVITVEDESGDSIRTAKVTSTYGQNLKDNDVRKDTSGQIYQGYFLVDEIDFKILVVPLAPQKIEVYTIYPNQKRGFLMTSKHFLGIPIFKAVYDSDKNNSTLDKIPYGSAEIFPLEYL